MGKSDKSWEKRLSGGPDEMAVGFVESLSFDRRLYKVDAAGSVAHARMLADVGLISEGEYEEIRVGLAGIVADIEAGRFEFKVELEDIHMAVEAALIERIGEAGRKLHTGRSRNDQVATDMRLWMREEIGKLQGMVAELQRAFVELAGHYTGDVMPSYTHLQRAQPVVIGAYLLSFVEAFERDYLRLGNCGDLLNVSPLGSGAIAGSTLGLDRAKTAELLGFREVSGNSIDSVSDRDFCAEFLFDCSLIAAHLSRFAEDWIIYSSSEFGFVRVDDAYCTSSSMMPQKRNPDMLELIRGKTGRVYGGLMAMLTILKGQPGGYNRDMQEDKVHVFGASDTVEACLGMACAIVRHARFNCGRIAAGLDEGFLDATGLAEYLVSKGVAFRKAHGIVGGLVAECEKGGKRLGEVELSEFKKHCEVIGEDVYGFLGAGNVAGRYVTEGAGGKAQVEKQIGGWQARLAGR